MKRPNRNIFMKALAEVAANDSWDAYDQEWLQWAERYELSDEIERSFEAQCPCCTEKKLDHRESAYLRWWENL